MTENPNSLQSFAVIPAAGHSRRMGRPKLLLPWRGTTVIQSLIANWQASRVGHVIAVVRQGDGALIEACQLAGVQVVTPASEPAEMKHSVQFGLEYVRDQFQPLATDVWLLAPADMPQLAAPVVDCLLDEHDGRSILVPVSDGKRGHPVLFPWLLAQEVAFLGENEGVNALLCRHPVREIDCGDQTILQDLDTPDDYRRLSEP